MTDRVTAFDSLAELLNYPTENYPTAVQKCRDAMNGWAPEAAPGIRSFFDHVAASRLDELEELYTRTFDLNPVCSLEVGWHLYGEDYNRGSFMVSMRQQIRALGIKETLELPDHLSNILPLLGRLQDAPAAELSRSFVLPALLKMEEALAGKQNPFADVLCAVRNVIEPKTTAGVAGLSCNDGLNGEETTHA